MKHRSAHRQLAASLALIALASSFTGCLRLEYTIALHAEDGGATVTERIAISQELQELDKATPAAQRLAVNLERDAALERLKHMGKGVTLTDHKLERLSDGSLESVAVFTIIEVQDLRLANPLLHGSAPRAMMRLSLGPGQGQRGDRRRWVNISAGVVQEAGAPAPPGGTPASLQVYRDLAPAFADLLRSLKIAVTITTPTTVTGGTSRGAGAGATESELLSFSGRDLDAGGQPFLENEEAMVSLLQVAPWSGAILGHTSQFVNNTTVPVLRHHGHGMYHPHSIQIHPTPHFERKFFGKQ